MTTLEINSIFNILSKISYIPVDEISAETDIFKDLDIDSLGIVETFVALERNFGVKLNPVLFTREDIQTPQKILHLISNAKNSA